MQQDIAQFKFVDPRMWQNIGPKPNAGPGEFANLSAASEQMSPTVILMEALNTETEHQRAIRRDKLHVVQGFTTDPAILHAALQRVVSPTTNEKYPQEDPDSLSNLETEAGVPKGPGLEDAEKRWPTGEAILRRAIKRSHSQQFLGQIMPSAKQEGPAERAVSAVALVTLWRP